MDDTEIKHVVEAALLAAGRPLTLDRLLELFTKKGSGPDRAAIRRALDALGADYAARGIEIKEVASGFRVQVKRTMSDWLAPLWEERAPRYTRALLETLALVAYRQPITRAEIEEVRGVVVSTNIVRTLLERGWIRVVGHRDVPGKPAMFGTTREFLDYFGLKRLEDLPPLAEIKDHFPETSPQADLIESLDTGPHLTIVGDEDTEAAIEHEPAPESTDAADSASGSERAAEEAALVDSAPQRAPEATATDSAPEQTAEALLDDMGSEQAAETLLADSAAEPAPEAAFAESAQAPMATGDAEPVLEATSDAASAQGEAAPAASFEAASGETTLEESVFDEPTCGQPADDGSTDQDHREVRASHDDDADDADDASSLEPEGEDEGEGDDGEREALRARGPER